MLDIGSRTQNAQIERYLPSKIENTYTVAITKVLNMELKPFTICQQKTWHKSTYKLHLENPLPAYVCSVCTWMMSKPVP